MRALLRRLARFIAPTAYGKLEAFNLVQTQADMSTRAPADQDLVDRVAELEQQLKEMRQDNRRVAELYDLVFERMRSDNPLI